MTDSNLTNNGAPHTPAPHVAPIDQDIATPAVAVRGLHKRFGDQVAVDNLSLDIPRGSFYGVVGPNGAGKTTAISMATGLLRPDSGAAFIAGHPVWLPNKNGALPIAGPNRAEDAKRAYGLLADGVPVFDRLSATEYLSYLGALRGLDSGIVAQRSTSLLEALDLASAGTKFIADFSAGMTKKILLAGALLHRPEVLILDEPLEAVDPVSAETIKQILRSYVHGGGTVVLSSHVMEVVEGLCSHVAIIAEGKVRASGTLEEVRTSSSLTQTFVDLVGGRALDESALGWLS